MAELEAMDLGKFYSLSFGERLDWSAKSLVTKGIRRPAIVMFAHFIVWFINYCCFALFAYFMPHATDLTSTEYGRLLFAKFLVWQHMAEAVGCCQGPLGGHIGLPNNWRYRLSTGTLKVPLLPVFGWKRNILDLFAHASFFIAGLCFLACQHYEFLYIRILVGLDVWIFFSDLLQFFTSYGHGYFTMLLSLCFPTAQGQLAGVQIALIFQWFFSGIGKMGPWFNYVNGPFMVQSRLLAGQRWLLRLLFKSEQDLRPTTLGIFIAQLAAFVEYGAPIALMIPSACVMWAGLIGITAMHIYILVMPAPFDVYSWNTCYMCAAVYLFYYNGILGFDWEGARTMHPALVAVLVVECLVCWYGQFFPDQVSYYLSHRYWAGNWVQAFWFAKKTEAVRQKLSKVKTFSGNPINLVVRPPLEPSEPTWTIVQQGYLTVAYVIVATLNVKAVVRFIEDICTHTGVSSIDELEFFSLPQYCCGEFRDQLYAPQLLEPIQQEAGFEEGECVMLHLGAFGLGRQSASFKIYDLKTGVVASGQMTRKGLASMAALPSKSLDRSLPLAPELAESQQPLTQS